jgi:molybdate transport system regulatory protein
MFSPSRSTTGVPHSGGLKAAATVVRPVTTDATGRGQAVLVESDTEFGERDAVLLRAIDRSGSVAGAAAELGRSRARALQRLEALESAFGSLVERRRGGSDGGGSQLTDAGRELLARYDRLAAALTAAATVPETVLHGTVTDVAGELATVRSPVGSLRTLHDDLVVDDAVQIRLGADAVTLHPTEDAPAPDATSARNRVGGDVVAVDRGETVIEVAVDVAVADDATDLDGEALQFRALVTAESASRLDLSPGREIVLSWKATATRAIPRRSP